MKKLASASEQASMAEKPKGMMMMGSSMKKKPMMKNKSMNMGDKNMDRDDMCKGYDND